MAEGMHEIKGKGTWVKWVTCVGGGEGGGWH
jgi:hypothetical protein